MNLIAFIPVKLKVTLFLFQTPVLICSYYTIFFWQKVNYVLIRVFDLGQNE